MVKEEGLNLLLDGILVTGASVGFVVFLLEVNCPGSLLSFLLGAELVDLLSSSSGTLLFSISSSLSSSLLFFPNFCLLLFPVGITLVPVGRRGLLFSSGFKDLGELPVNLDLNLPLDAVVGGTVSLSCSSSSSLSSSSILIFTLFLVLLLPPVSELSNLGLSLFLPLKAVPVISLSEDWIPGILLIIPDTETGSTDGTVATSGLRENVGGTLTVCELGNVACSTCNLGGKMALLELS